MRKVSAATVATIMAIALYFTLFWGYDALRVLTSPTYGLDDVWRSQFVFGIGSYFKLSPMGLMKLAAFFGAVKLAVALACAIHIADRLRSLAGGTANADIFEGGLVLVVAVSLASVGPSVWSQHAELLREQVVHALEPLDHFLQSHEVVAMREQTHLVDIQRPTGDDEKHARRPPAAA